MSNLFLAIQPFDVVAIFKSIVTRWYLYLLLVAVIVGIMVFAIIKKPKKQRTFWRGRFCLSKKCAVYLFYIAMPPLEQSGVFPTDLFVFYDAILECYMPYLPNATPHLHSFYHAS